MIPVWSKDAMPSAFDTTGGVGGAVFDPEGDLDRQAADVAELCARKLDALGPAGIDEQTSML